MAGPDRRTGHASIARQGVTVVVCDGHRCHALRDRTDTGVEEGEASTLLGALRECVHRTRYAVLIRSGCLGVCARAPAVGLIRRTGSQTETGLFGPVERPVQLRELLAAVSADGDGPAPDAMPRRHGRPTI